MHNASVLRIDGCLGVRLWNGGVLFTDVVSDAVLSGQTGRMLSRNGDT